MANIKSQIKRNRQNESRRQRNKAERSELKTKIKHYTTAAESGEASASDMLKEIHKSLDQAAAKGIIHKNKASNQKSRLSKKLNA